MTKRIVRPALRLHCLLLTVDGSPCTAGGYVDLSQNPERFTGYAGKAARSIWKAIYEENCFGVKPKTVQAETYSPLALNPLLQIASKEEQEPEGECLEKRVYYKIISGARVFVV
jgi:ERO1-like protein beta